MSQSFKKVVSLQRQDARIQFLLMRRDETYLRRPVIVQEDKMLEQLPHFLYLESDTSHELRGRLLFKVAYSLHKRNV